MSRILDEFLSSGVDRSLLYRDSLVDAEVGEIVNFILSQSILPWQVSTQFDLLHYHVRTHTELLQFFNLLVDRSFYLFLLTVRFGSGSLLLRLVTDDSIRLLFRYWSVAASDLHLNYLVHLAR